MNVPRKLVVAALLVPYALGLFNFLVLQWFGVRLARRYRTVIDLPASKLADLLEVTLHGVLSKAYGAESMLRHPAPDPPPMKRVRDGWVVLRWVWPLTGWWSPYWWIMGGPAIQLRVVDQATKHLRKVNRRIRRAIARGARRS